MPEIYKSKIVIENHDLVIHSNEFGILLETDFSNDKWMNQLDGNPIYWHMNRHDCLKLINKLNKALKKSEVSLEELLLNLENEGHNYEEVIKHFPYLQR